MPTYVCSVPEGSLNATQKTLIAQAITRVHSESTGAPQFFVQVMIDENKSVDRFLGGHLAANHVWIRGDIRAGRTEDQRKTLMVQIVKEVSQIAGISEESIWVYLCNLEPTDMLEYGHVLPAPGDEKAWFERLPPSLQDYLAGLGTTKNNFGL
jgi:phenylpyruvate tautomerase PptA (4-oxalocrotonate tautomerase family)